MSSLIKSADVGIKWCVAPLRESLPEADFVVAADKAEKHECDLACITQLDKNWSYAISSASDENVYKLADFGAALADYANKNSYVNFVYVEAMYGHTGQYICVLVTPEAIIDTIVERDSVVDTISRLTRNVVDSVTCVVGGSSDADLVSHLTSFGILHVELSPLTLVLSPYDFQFKVLDEALNIKRTSYALPISLAVLCSIMIFIYVFINKEPPPPPPVNPHVARIELINQSVSALNRANQIIDSMRQLRAVVGWKLVSVNQGVHSLAFRMNPNSGALASELEMFSRQYGFTVLREPNAPDSSLVLVKMPVNTANTADLRLFDVDEVISFISDALSLYVPNSKLTLIRVTPDASKTWGTVELALEVREANNRYLNTIGAILLGLPVSIGGAPGDLAVGDLAVSGESVSGVIKLLVVGQRKNWQ